MKRGPQEKEQETDRHTKQKFKKENQNRLKEREIQGQRALK